MYMSVGGGEGSLAGDWYGVDGWMDGWMDGPIMRRGYVREGSVVCCWCVSETESVRRACTTCVCLAG